MGRLSAVAGCWIWLAWAAVSSSPAEAQSKRMDNPQSKRMDKMPDDPFFNRVSAQLMAIPSASRQALAAAARGEPQRAPEAARFPIQSAKSWVKLILKPDYQPPASTPFLAFPMEGGVCDVVRAIYSAHETDIEVAESKYLITVSLKEHAAPGGRDVENAERILRAALTMDDRISLTRSGEFRSGSYGTEVPGPKGSVDANWPHWLDAMRWWRDGGETGLLTLKAPGGPTMEMISPEEDSNRHWFN